MSALNVPALRHRVALDAPAWPQRFPSASSLGSEWEGSMRLGLSGFGKHPWQSIERTRQFYARSLGAAFDLYYLGGDADGWFNSRPDAVLNFTGSRCWQLGQHPNCPLLFAMHGGPILNQTFLRAHLGRLETTDVLIVNCRSDLAIL